jgi:hypothetical protein
MKRCYAITKTRRHDLETKISLVMDDTGLQYLSFANREEARAWILAEAQRAISNATRVYPQRMRLQKWEVRAFAMRSSALGAGWATLTLLREALTEEAQRINGEGARAIQGGEHSAAEAANGPRRLNARGEPLLPADLLRNFIFLRAARNGEPQETLYENYWKQFDDEFWRHEVRQGRLSRPTKRPLHAALPLQPTKRGHSGEALVRRIQVLD